MGDEQAPSRAPGGRAVIRPDRHEQVGEILIEVLERRPEERGIFLQSACAGDLALRREVETLLKSHEGAGNVLEVPVPPGMSLSEDIGMEGRLVGPYRLMREIGRGGMAVVYLAVRADETFDKKVAVKLVKRGTDTEEVVRRFENERRILAGLDHPNIARILDGGTSDEGLPYFVMEYVDGLPLLEYCDSHRLSVNERLRLFVSICSAVAFAHQNLVVHRDLKPSNILVDPAGAPRLLDFGIAKLLSASEFATKTLTSLRPMTPWYCSPEQIRGETVNTASDVYSLGVLLYELLTGRMPYRITSRAAHDVERAVCEEEPERPSVAVARRGDEIQTADGELLPVMPESVSASREGDPKKLRRRLAGDLDTIALRALQKEPRRRYGSVEQLSDDISRHLSGLPIRARKDTVLYRGGKFIRRHAFGAAAVALFVLLAIGATAVMAVQRARIQRERLKAEQVSALLTSLFKASDPRDARGNNLTVREMLDKGGQRIQRELAGQPEVQATLMNTIGDVYMELGLYDQARRMIADAYKTRLRLFGEKDLRVAESLQSLGELSNNTGKYAEGENQLREALSLRRRFLGEKNAPVAETLLALGAVLHHKGDDRGSEAVLRKALSVRSELFGDRDLAVANVWHALAATLASLGESDEAEKALQKALAIARNSSDPDNPGVAAYRNDLGIIIMAKGKFREAAGLYRESLESRRRLVGEDHPSVAALMANLAAALDLDGQSEEAEGLSRKAMAIAQRTLGNDHPNMGFAWNNLATILRRKGDAAGAESAARESLRIMRANLPERHLIVSGPLLNLGWSRNARGHPGEAEPLLRQALEIRKSNLKEGDWRISEVESLLGACLASQGHFEDAEPLLTQGYVSMRDRIGPEGKMTKESLERLVALYEQWRKPERAQFYRAELYRNSRITDASSLNAKN